MKTSAVAPYAFAVFSAMRCMSLCACFRQSSSNVRIMHSKSTFEGMILVLPSAMNLPTEKVVGIVGLALRLTRVWSAMTTCEAATMGSMSSSGVAPCPPLPLTSMYISSVDAMYLPSFMPIFPVSISGVVWRANIFDGVMLLNIPALSIVIAPPG